jgi:predicted transcriptional regulator
MEVIVMQQIPETPVQISTIFTEDVMTAIEEKYRSTIGDLLNYEVNRPLNIYERDINGKIIIIKQIRNNH